MQHIAGSGEHRQAVEQVISIRPPAGNVQEEIDLRRGELDQAVRFDQGIRAALVVAWAVVSCSLASSLAASAGAGLKISARRH